MITNKECFAYTTKNKKSKCVALNVDNCENCNFFKTKEEYEAGLKKYPIRK